MKLWILGRLELAGWHIPQASRHWKRSCFERILVHSFKKAYWIVLSLKAMANMFKCADKEPIAVASKSGCLCHNASCVSYLKGTCPRIQCIR